MAIHPILIYPDKRLKRISEEVVSFTDHNFQCLVDDLVETMNAGPGCVGVAAPQINYPIRVVAINGQAARKPAPNHGLLVLCNPVILKWSGMEVGREGCLSLPHYTANVVRATEIELEFKDRHGAPHTLTMTDFEARIVQHELDHLDGKLFVDRVVSRKTDLFPRKSYSSPSSSSTR